MEALSLILTTKMVADDVRRSTGGYDEVRRTADEALRVQRRKHRVWSALRRSITNRWTRSEAGGKRGRGSHSRRGTVLG